MKINDNNHFKSVMSYLKHIGVKFNIQDVIPIGIDRECEMGRCSNLIKSLDARE